MSGIDEILDLVIDVDAAMESIRALLNDERVFVAAGLIHLDCGHLRPTNLRVEPGERHQCMLCGDAHVVSLELIEPTVYPHADALRDLREAVR